jgi:hypothetical protein
LPLETRGVRSLKKHIAGLLYQDDLDKAFEELCRLPGLQAVNPLFSLLLHQEEKPRWRAVIAMGVVVKNLADTNMEGGRTVMRRLMWSLNEESGGIGWGAPEAMAEIMARHEGLAEEFSAVFTSYMDRSGNFLEYEVLQRGVLWGLARLAVARPDLVRGSVAHISQYLESTDAAVRGLAAQAAGLLMAAEVRPQLQALVDDTAEFRSFIDTQLVNLRVGEVAEQALASLDRGNARTGD